MSHIGKSKIIIPPKVNVKLEYHKPGYMVLIASSELGKHQIILNNLVKVDIIDNSIILQIKDTTKYHKALWGLYRTLVSNLLSGLVQKYSVKLNISGIGYKYSLNGNKLTLKLGYSHDVEYDIDDNIEVKSISSNIIELLSIDKQQVHQVASEIKSFKKPDSYKGKGIRYHKEKIILKQGKRG